MFYKTLFAPLAFEETAGIVTDAALLLAGTFKGHVVAHHVRQRYVFYPPADFFPSMGPTISLAQQSHDEATAAFARTIRAAFEECCDASGAKIVPITEALKQTGTTASWTDETSRLSENYSLAARICDLIVTAIPGFKDAHLERDIFETLLLQSGAPLLAIPRAGLASSPRRPLVAWDGSLQASRVVRAAMPMLAQSEETILLTVGETDDGAPSVAAAAAWLERAGIKVIHRTVEWPKGPIAERLINQCDAVQADLVVMGAYSHSRLQEAVMGGVTRQMLHHSNRPLMLVH